MSDEEEVDYMSENFLAECVGSNDIRPGLTHSHSNKRKNCIERKKKEKDEFQRKKKRSIKDIQEEKLKDGLSKALDSSNKGFAMMTKMGFKPGTSLGKDGAGITEPIPMNLKSDRVGLGWQQLIKEKKEELKVARLQKNKEFNPTEYRAHRSNLHSQKLVTGDLNKSRKVCFDLDSKEGLVEPPEYWFWPHYTWQLGDEEDEEQLSTDKNMEERSSSCLYDGQDDGNTKKRLNFKEQEEEFEVNRQKFIPNLLERECSVEYQTAFSRPGICFSAKRGREEFERTPNSIFEDFPDSMTPFKNLEGEEKKVDDGLQRLKSARIETLDEAKLSGGRALSESADKTVNLVEMPIANKNLSEEVDQKKERRREKKRKYKARKRIANRLGKLSQEPEGSEEKGEEPRGKAAVERNPPVRVDTARSEAATGIGSGHQKIQEGSMTRNPNRKVDSEAKRSNNLQPKPSKTHSYADQAGRGVTIVVVSLNGSDLGEDDKTIILQVIRRELSIGNGGKAIGIDTVFLSGGRLIIKVDDDHAASWVRRTVDKARGGGKYRALAPNGLPPTVKYGVFVKEHQANDQKEFIKLLEMCNKEVNSKQFHIVVVIPTKKEAPIKGATYLVMVELPMVERLKRSQMKLRCSVGDVIFKPWGKSRGDPK